MSARGRFALRLPDLLPADSRALLARFDAARKPRDVVIDQPCCVFTPRVPAARVGDAVVVRNPAPVTHNFFWTSGNNGDLNVNLAPKQEHRFAKPLVAEAAPIPNRCTVHPWMTGAVRVFDHPYYAVTDADGAFTIADAPAGNDQSSTGTRRSGSRAGRPAGSATRWRSPPPARKSSSRPGST